MAGLLFSLPDPHAPIDNPPPPRSPPSAYAAIWIEPWFFKKITNTVDAGWYECAGEKKKKEEERMDLYNCETYKLITG